MALTFGLGLLWFCATAWSATGVVVAQSQTVTSQPTAYARVVPITIATLRTAQAGVVRVLNAKGKTWPWCPTGSGRLGIALVPAHNTEKS